MTGFWINTIAANNALDRNDISLRSISSAQLFRLASKEINER